MAYCLYNGHKLPELPEYDENEYPDAVICEMPLTGSYFLQLFGGNWSCAYDVSTSELPVTYPIVAQGAKRYAHMKYSSDNYWTDLGIQVGDFAIYGGDDLIPVWSNFDIYWEDGSTYLEASEPIKLFDLKDWIRGMVIGVASKPVPFGGVIDGDN